MSLLIPLLRFSLARLGLCLFLALALSAIAGCAGGGSSVHIPPDHIVAGQPTTLKVTFSVWGAGWGNLSKRYTRIECHYRKSGETQFQSVAARVLSSNREQMEAEFIIPPQSMPVDSSSLEYYFDFLFDGYENKRPPETVQIVAPPV